MVRGAYAVSWAYLIGDVSHEGWKAYCRNQKARNPEIADRKDLAGSLPAPGTSTALAARTIPAIEDYRAVMAQRAVFQSIASMGLPAFTIHSIVRYSGRAMKNVRNTTLRTWGPIGVSHSQTVMLTTCC